MTNKIQNKNDTRNNKNRTRMCQRCTKYRLFDRQLPEKIREDSLNTPKSQFDPQTVDIYRQSKQHQK